MNAPDVGLTDLARPQELTLARQIQRGEVAALERFHTLYSQALYRYVFYRLEGVVPDVEEVVQDTFLAALEGLHRFRGRSSLFTWLCGIAKHRIARVRRQRSRERLAAVLEDSEAEIAAIVTRLELAPLPDEILEREETQDLVGATMASLPPSYQRVLIEKYVDSLPVLEIARKQRSTPKAVESTLTRARVAFRKTFELLTRRLQGGARHG